MAAVDPYPSSTVLTVDPNTPLIIGREARLLVTISSAGGSPLGTVAFYETISGTSVLIGNSPLNGLNWDTGLYLPSGFDLGLHSIVAEYSGTGIVASSTSNTLAFEIGPAVPTLVLTGPASVETHHSFDLSGWVNSSVYDSGGTLSLWRVGGLSAICSFADPGGQIWSCTLASQPVGIDQYVLKFSGTTRVLAATSDPFSVTVTADTVHAHAVTILYSTFYPVTDGYRDVESIRGARDEPSSVGIHIYNSANGLVRSASIALASGSYTYNWNGRNSSGVVLPEGKYRVVQTLRDSAGTVRNFTNYAVLSKKHLIYKTVSITKRGSSFTARGTSGTGTTSVSTTYGYIILKPGSAGWAGAGWEFTIPSATIYKSIKFQVYAKALLSAPPKYMGLQNFTKCPYVASTSWYESCFDHWVSFGNQAGTTAWFTAGGSVSTNRYGHIVRGMVSVPFSTTYIYDARATVYYAVVGY